MQAELSGIVLDCADAQCLAQFYEALLGWPREDAAPGWAALSAPGGWTLAFQQVPGYTPPVWPWREGVQGQMLHLDFHVKGLQAAVRHALGLVHRAPLRVGPALAVLRAGGVRRAGDRREGSARGFGPGVLGGAHQAD